MVQGRERIIPRHMQQITILKPLHTETATVKIDTNFSSGTADIVCPVNADFQVDQIVVNAYHKGGAVVKSSPDRDRLTISIQSNNTDEEYIKDAVDIFALDTYAQSLGFRSFIIKRQTQLKLTVNHTQDVIPTDPNPSLTVPIVVEVTLIGKKVQVSG